MKVSAINSVFNLLIVMHLAKSVGSVRQTPGAQYPASIFYSVFLFLFFFPEN